MKGFPFTGSFSSNRLEILQKGRKERANPAQAVERRRARSAQKSALQEDDAEGGKQAGREVV